MSCACCRWTCIPNHAAPLTSAGTHCNAWGRECQAAALIRLCSCCAGYPWLGIYVFVPCALLAALGLWVPFTACVMTLDMLWNSWELIWNSM